MRRTVRLARIARRGGSVWLKFFDGEDRLDGNVDAR